MSTANIDYNIPKLVAIRLINPLPSPAATVAKQLGALQGSLSRELDGRHGNQRILSCNRNDG